MVLVRAKRWKINAALFLSFIGDISLGASAALDPLDRGERRRSRLRHRDGSGGLRRCPLGRLDCAARGLLAAVGTRTGRLRAVWHAIRHLLLHAMDVRVPALLPGHVRRSKQARHEVLPVGEPRRYDSFPLRHVLPCHYLTRLPLRYFLEGLHDRIGGQDLL